MKRIFTILCALALVMAGSATALAADDTGQSASYYPISVEEYTYGDFDELRINKTYQLSLSDDPSLIPTEDFVRNGRRYYLLDMTRKDEVGVDIQTHTEAVTQASDTNNLETILQRLDAEMEVATEDGYVGILRLDHTSVQVTTDGYATKTSTLTASRSYPNLSEADTSLIPKSIEDKGKTLTLGDVKWSESAVHDDPRPDVQPAPQAGSKPPQIRTRESTVREIPADAGSAPQVRSELPKIKTRSAVTSAPSGGSTAPPADHRPGTPDRLSIKTREACIQSQPAPEQPSQALMQGRQFLEWNAPTITPS